MAAPQDEDWPPAEPVAVPITGELDLHTFRPNEIGDLLRDYLEECRKAGLERVRVIHGKGSGALRNGVHQLLPRLPGVRQIIWPAAADQGGWGATVVLLSGA